jgi:hypothetical protein
MRAHDEANGDRESRSRAPHCRRARAELSIEERETNASRLCVGTTFDDEKVIREAPSAPEASEVGIEA